MPEERAVVTRLKKPDDWIKRQLENLKAVGEANFKVGVAYPKKDTIAEGIAAEDKFEAAMKKALEEERRKKALEYVTLQEWFGYTMNIGAPRRGRKGSWLTSVVLRHLRGLGENNLISF